MAVPTPKPSSTHPQLGQIVILGLPSFLKRQDKEFTSKFQFLSPSESNLPLDQFLAAEAQNTQAAVCSGGFKISADVLRHLPSLRLIVTTSTGFNQIDLSECRKRGISVANAGNIYSADVADLAVGMIIDVMRKISAGNRFVKSGLCPKQGNFPLGSKLGGKQIGIVGLGSIGVQVAKRLEAFGCKISYYSRKKKPFSLYTFHSDIHELASVSDILVICCALTEKTRHMINREVLLALGKEGLIVNVARGAVIDEKELVRCLVRQEIAGAGLDVFEHEPHVPRELFGLDNVVLSPHSAALTEGVFRNTNEIVTGNLEAFFSNRPLLSPVLDDE
ncbi:glyoxylate/hydroxypyruvate reductase HPR3-like [Olea europaea var. sylvestris]|uniref:glyoxylate/hydroxypyruvate reductase HPR3-like n=1 Tax=Olea europaea var. sylvestris TaxID=158386 RepID=UPI000C1D5CAE|nr:glyoxylate/hydroxypyruvate reductase HPR3-like [Olea europaea var. sylvestris]